MARPRNMSTLILIYIVIFAAVGLWDALAIHLKEIASATNPDVFQSCHLNSVLDCGAVARSRASHFAGVPVSLFGILFYEGALLGTIVMLMGFRPAKWLASSLSVLAVVALFFSFRLLYISWFGLGVLCIYCLVSNLSTLMVVIGWFWYTKVARLLSPDSSVG